MINEQVKVMTKLEELKAAAEAADAALEAAEASDPGVYEVLEAASATYDAALFAAYDAHWGGKAVDKVDEQAAKEAYDAAWADKEAYDRYWCAAWDAAEAARNAYEAELKKTQEENSND